jgi:hypothetical protein
MKADFAATANMAAGHVKRATASGGRSKVKDFFGQ